MTEANRVAVSTLQVSNAQRAFVDPILDTLALYDQEVSAAGGLERDNFVLDVSDVVVGFFQIAPSRNARIVADLLVLHEVQIDAAHQGQGYGKQFMELLPAFLVREYPGERGVCLTVNCKNHLAYGLYQSGGFVDSGALYHGGRSGPQHIMQRYFEPD